MPEQVEKMILVGEYVLGTLNPSERKKLNQERKTDIILNEEIEMWERYLSPLINEIPSVKPSKQLWKNIEAKMPVNEKQKTTQSAESRWRQIAIAACIVAIIAVTGNVYNMRQQSQPEAQSVALLQKNNETAFLLSLNQDKKTLTVNLEKAELPTDVSYQLWIIADGKTPPKSIGIITATKTILAFDSSNLNSETLSNATFAVSREPKGGSPTGLPTGPVISTGKLSTL